MTEGGRDGPRTANGIPEVWGATAEEVAAPFPCDEHLVEPDAAWFRAVTVGADCDTVFRWLTQLKVAPYSYDLVDNLGRRSPRVLTPGTDRLEAGQRVMTIFVLVDFHPSDHLTLSLREPWAVQLFGEMAISYTVRSTGHRRTRLVAKLLVRHPRRPSGSLETRLLAWGDLMMMRRQLLTLKALAETSDTRPPRAVESGSDVRT
jgi:hypothetical protein